MIKEEHAVDNLGRPQGSGPMMSTVVNIQTETAVPDHVLWSLFSTVYFNICCLGLLAFAYSVKARDQKMKQDTLGAHSAASTAKKLNIAALVLCLLVTITCVALWATGALPYVYRAPVNRYRGS